jgi:hypothetical protein
MFEAEDQATGHVNLLLTYIETIVLLHFASVTSRFFQMKQRQFPGSKPAAGVAAQHAVTKNVYRSFAGLRSSWRRSKETRESPTKAQIAVQYSTSHSTN